MPVQISVQGLEAAQIRLENDAIALSGRPMVQAMKAATLLVQGSAIRFVPVDTGRLRASITPEVISGRMQRVRGIVGSNLLYAPYMELGTGTYVGKSSHRPPSAALHLWAKRHNIPGGGRAVAMSIAARGGLAPRRYLQAALAQNARKIYELLGRTVARIIV